MMDWLGKMLQLPEAFLAENAGEGGGVIQVRWGGWGAQISGVQVPQRDHGFRKKRCPPVSSGE